MQIVILAGGLGSRLRPITETTPKPMILINNKPFLEYQIELLKKNNICNIVLCIGYLGEKIKNYFGNGKKWGVNIKYSIENKKLLGTAGALKNAYRYLDKEFLVMYGDSYLQLDFNELIRYYKKTGAEAVMTVYKNNNRYDRSNIEIKDNLVVKYEKNSKEKLFYIDYGVSILTKKLVSELPENRQIQLEEVFRNLITQKKLYAFVVKKRFYEIGSIEGLKQFKNFVRRKLQ
jgi:NDP-sugar pyrophosphorylase family protein